MANSKRHEAVVDQDDDGSTLEGTLALIKPDAIHNSTKILARIAEEGFLIVEKQRMNFSRAKAARFYENHQKSSHFEDLINYITSGEVIALCLAGKDGINHWRRVLGPARPSEARILAPTSIRAQFGDLDNDAHNAAHGSDSPESSEREIEIVFPHILHGEANREIDRNVDMQAGPDKDYLKKFVCPTLLRGISEMNQIRPKSPIPWLADWLLDNNPYKK